MNGQGRKVVLLGMMTKIPVAGFVWQTIHYLVGLERLGYDAYYVEAHARTPSMFMEHKHDDGSGKAAAFIDRVMGRFDLAGRWAFHALHEEGGVYGMGERELNDLYASADLLINLHGGTERLPPARRHWAPRLCRDNPVALQFELDAGRQKTIAFSSPTARSSPSPRTTAVSGLPAADYKSIRPEADPPAGRARHVAPRPGSSEAFTTVGSVQPWRDVWFAGEWYSWSKHDQFREVLDLPARTDQGFELVLAGCDGEDRPSRRHGWGVRPAEAI